MNNYQIKVLTSFAELEPLRPFWESGQYRPSASFEFFEMIIRNRSEIVSPCVLALWREGELIALWIGRIENANFPVRFGYATLAKLRVRRLVLLDGGFIGEKTEATRTSAFAYLPALLRDLNLDLAVTEQIRIPSPEYEIARRVFHPLQWCAAHATSEHYLLKFPTNWEEFLKLRSKKHRYWLKRLSNVLDSEFSGQWTIRRYASVTEAREFVETAEAVANTTYHRGLGVGFRLSEESLQRVDLEARQCQLQGYVLFIKGQPKAFWYCGVYQRNLHLSATGYDPAYRSYELGTVLLMRIFQDHCGTEVEMVDFGLGDAGYKQRFASEHFTEASFYLFAGSVRGLLLNGLHRMMFVSSSAIKKVLEKVGGAQRLKTRWRHTFERKNEKPKPGSTQSLDTTISHPARSGPLLLLGADPAGTNFGVAALALGTIATWLKSRPGAAVSLLEYESQPNIVPVMSAGRQIHLPLINMRFSWKLYLSNNILRLLWTSLWTRLLPRSWRESVRRREPCLRAIQEASVIAALSGGDSFSDIYGLRRFFYTLLPQMLIVWMGRSLVLLPQTYGPYRTSLARRFSGYILKRASRVYSRDQTGIEVVRSLAGERNGTVRFAYDLGFALEPHPPSPAQVHWLDDLKAPGPLVGLNVSGLLYCGGYTRTNMFNLKTDYPDLLQKLLQQLLANESGSVVLVSHVFGNSMENDSSACRNVRERLPMESRARVYTAEGQWSAAETKYLIGQCDFFIGSRMHACIAALSQGVPAAGLAYSRKFAGVFESVGVSELVFNLAELSAEQVVEGVTSAFKMRRSYEATLQSVLPQVRDSHRSIFDLETFSVDGARSAFS